MFQPFNFAPFGKSDSGPPAAPINQGYLLQYLQGMREFDPFLGQMPMRAPANEIPGLAEMLHAREARRQRRY